MNNDSNLAVLDAPAPGQIFHVPAAPPTIEQTLAAAVQSGMSGDGIEKIAAIYEREMARRAAIAFTVALTAFHQECPSIVKNREARDRKKNDELMYRYADMEHITRIVRPLLFKHGFRYSWDTDLAGDKTTIVCNLVHNGGHQESSRFTARGTGTSIMSAAQIEASVTTFGQRRTLLAVLGLSVDTDDDGRGTPNPQPDADPTAPRVGTRETGHAPQPPHDPNRVTAEDLNVLLTQFRNRTEKPDATPADMAEWAARVTGIDAALLKSPRNWTREGLTRCKEAML